MPKERSHEVPAGPWDLSQLQLHRSRNYEYEAEKLKEPRRKVVKCVDSGTTAQVWILVHLCSSSITWGYHPLLARGQHHACVSMVATVTEHLQCASQGSRSIACINSTDPQHKPMKLYDHPHSEIKKLKHREVNCLVQGHVAGNWQGWDLNPGNPALKQSYRKSTDILRKKTGDLQQTNSTLRKCSGRRLSPSSQAFPSLPLCPSAHVACTGLLLETESPETQLVLS